MVILFYCGVEQSCEKLEVLLHSEVFIQGKLARHISDDISYRHIFLVSVEPFNRSASGIRQNQRREYAEKSAFSGAVWAYNSECLATADIESDSVNGFY